MTAIKIDTFMVSRHTFTVDREHRTVYLSTGTIRIALGDSDVDSLITGLQVALRELDNVD